jgi:hypothetical protein
MPDLRMPRLVVARCCSVTWPEGVPVVCCLACGHAHPAKAWVWTPQDDQHAAVGICAGCHDAALHLRGQCAGRGCLCVDGNPAAAVTRNSPAEPTPPTDHALAAARGGFVAAPAPPTSLRERVRQVIAANEYAAQRGKAEPLEDAVLALIENGDVFETGRVMGADAERTRLRERVLLLPTEIDDQDRRVVDFAAVLALFEEQP